MKKKPLVTSALSALLISTAILAQAAYADERDDSAVISETQQEQVAEASAVSESSEAVLTAEKSTYEPSGDNTASSEVETASSTAVNSQEINSEAITVNSEIASSSETAKETSGSESASDSDTVTILHTNDMHGRIVEGTDVIGTAKLAAIAAEARKNGSTLVFDSGDAFQGLPISNSSKGEDMATIMNAIGYDAMTIGNHEFDFGLNQLVNLSEQLTFPLLTSNVYVNGARLFQASTVIDKDKNIEGDEVVVIGVTTPETATKTHPSNVVGVSFTDPITEVETVISQIEAQARAENKTYKTYIILAHLGVDNTTKTEWQGTTLAQALSKYEPLAGKKVIVLDGHSHTVLTATYGNVTYNQTGSYLNNVGKVTLNSDRILSQGVINTKEGQAYEADPNILKLVSNIQAKYKAESSTVVIDNSPVELNGERTNVRVRETNLGNAVADALFKYGQTGFTHKSNLAVTNGGGLRETIAKNKPVTKGDIIAVLPFGNTVTQIQVTGQNIYDMFVKSLGSITQVDSQAKAILDQEGLPLLEPSGGFLQVSGVKVYYDTTLEAAKRVLGIQIWDTESESFKDLDLKATYYLTTNDFLAAGGDGFTMLGGSREEGPSMDAVFADYLVSADLNQYEIINPNSRLIAISAANYSHFNAINKNGRADQLSFDLIPADSEIVAIPVAYHTDTENTGITAAANTNGTFELPSAESVVKSVLSDNANISSIEIALGKSSPNTSKSKAGKSDAHQTDTKTEASNVSSNTFVQIILAVIAGLVLIAVGLLGIRGHRKS
ncbi:5'-nucleotidase C-terminal domain-containing protein [Streptococcus dentiloxodontae]